MSFEATIQPNSEAAECIENSQQSERISVLYEQVTENPSLPYPWKTTPWKCLAEPPVTVEMGIDIQSHCESVTFGLRFGPFGHPCW